MTQSSRPVAQHTDNYPDGDSGPYSSAQWRELFSALFTQDPTAQGPIAGYLNELEVTEPVANTVRVATGGGIVNGNVFFNDAVVDFQPPAPTGSARYDYVVMCLNETATAFATSDAGHTLAFPTSLTDYDASASIQEYACRLAIVRGTEGAGLPTLDQNDDHYMVPLASYLISLGGVVSGLTDRRERALFQSGLEHKVFVPVAQGNNYDTSTLITPDPDVELTAAGDISGWAYWMVPQGYISDLSFNPLLAYTLASDGDLYGASYWDMGACGEPVAAHTQAASYSLGTIPSVALYYNLCSEWTANVAAASPGDILRMTFRRQGANGGDDAGAVLLRGFIVTYIGYS